jgi:hypothetical protein
MFSFTSSAYSLSSVAVSAMVFTTSSSLAVFSKLTPINLENGETVFEFGFGYCWHEVKEEVK